MAGVGATVAANPRLSKLLVKMLPKVRLPQSDGHCCLKELDKTLLESSLLDFKVKALPWTAKAASKANHCTARLSSFIFLKCAAHGKFDETNPPKSFGSNH